MVAVGGSMRSLISHSAKIFLKEKNYFRYTNTSHKNNKVKFSGDFFQKIRIRRRGRWYAPHKNEKAILQGTTK